MRASPGPRETTGCQSWSGPASQITTIARAIPIPKRARWEIRDILSVCGGEPGADILPRNRTACVASVRGQLTAAITDGQEPPGVLEPPPRRHSLQEEVVIGGLEQPAE